MRSDRIRVLFVDDEEGNLKAFKASFRRDMEVLLASSGAEALELLGREEVHVIISDQRMPGMTGSEFLSIARERYPQSMRMLLTGYADLEAVVQAVNQGGIYAYSTKPWDENDLKLEDQQAFEIQQLRLEKESLLGRFKQIFETSADPIVIVDRTGKMLEANEACARLLSTKRTDLLAGSFTDHLEDPRSLVRNLRKHRNGKSFVNVDLTLRSSSGSVIDCLMTATYLGDQDGHRDVFQAILKDISDRKQEEKRLTKLNHDLDKRVSVRTAQLLEALEDLGSFSYSVAHDLRSPLKNIAAMSAMLSETAEGDPALITFRPFAERIQRGADRMIQLVDDLLRFAQTNTRELERKPILLAQLAQAALEDSVPNERRQQVGLELDSEAMVLADAPMMKVVLHNLLSNALKFTRSIPSPIIVIGHAVEEGFDHIWVRDNGVGFDAKHKEQAFGVFKRLHQQDQFEGTGVGLAIVHRVVSKHSGEVWAESAVDQGTTIHIRLPRVETAHTGLPFAYVA